MWNNVQYNVFFETSTSKEVRVKLWVFPIYLDLDIYMLLIQLNIMFIILYYYIISSYYITFHWIGLHLFQWPHRYWTAADESIRL